MGTSFSLDQVRVASPCPMRWEDMAPVGSSGAVRHCGQCRLNVHDLSSMTREEAEDLVSNAEGRLCATFFIRADGTILTSDCPVGVRAARARLARWAGRAAAALALLITGGALAGAKTKGVDGTRLGSLEPFATIRGWLLPAVAPQQQLIKVAGEVCPPSRSPGGAANVGVAR